jgi:hypothetical protein
VEKKSPTGFPKRQACVAVLVVGYMAVFSVPGLQEGRVAPPFLIFVVSVN